MEFLGIGPLELIAILIIILLVIGPKDIERTARSLGQGLNRFTRSDNYRVIQQLSQELRGLPQQLMRDANLEGEIKQIDQDLSQVGQQIGGQMQHEADTIKKAWTETTSPVAPPATAPAPALPKPPSDKPTA